MLRNIMFTPVVVKQIFIDAADVQIQRLLAADGITELGMVNAHCTILEERRGRP